MKTYLTVILVFLVVIQGMAQTSGTLSGRVFDKPSGNPLTGATVGVLIGETDRLASGTITDENGRFIVSGLPVGRYKVVISYVGYRAEIRPLLIGELNKAFDLGRIELEMTTESLAEVTVSGQKVTVNAGLDKKTYDRETFLAQAGGSVMDAMKALPGISFDQEGKAILRGSDKVVVLIDGKQSSLTGFGSQKGLDNLPATMVEKIEIINNPSAKYDAAGMAGIINIIFKKEKEKGFNGDIGLAGGLGTLYRQKADLPTDLGSYAVNPKGIPSINLNFKTSRFHFYNQAEAMQQRMLPNNEFTTRMYDDGHQIASQVPENRTQTHFIEKAGITWLINPSNSLTLSAVYDWEIHIDTAQIPFIDLASGTRYRYWGWREEEITGFFSTTGTFKHEFPQPGHQITVNSMFTRGWENENYSLRDSSALRTGKDSTHILAIENIANVAVDYVKPMSNGRLEAGSKLQVRRLPVEYTTDRGIQSVIYPGIGDWSNWGENLFGAYLNYVLEKNRFDVEAGLRAEETEVFYQLDPDNIYYRENDSYRYFELFPNVRLTLKPDESNSISLFFNRRIDRPGEPELRVFPKYDDPELLKVGNPYLRPQLTESYELAFRHKWKSGNLFLSGYHRRIHDPFMRIYSADSTSTGNPIMNKIYQNTGEASNTGIEVIYSQQVNKWLKVTASFNPYYNLIEAFEGTLLFPFERPFQIGRSSDFTFDSKVTAQATLPGSIQLQCSGIYYAPKNLPQGTQLARSSIDLGFKKILFDGKGEITLSVSDLFNRFSIRQQVNGDGFTALYENYYETQVVRLAFRYRF